MRVNLNIFSLLVLLIGLLSTTFISANEIENKVNDVKRDEIHASLIVDMLAGLPKPPFIIEENGRGLQLDIVREAFISVNHKVNFTHLPLGRTISGFKRFDADGIVTYLQSINTLVFLFLSPTLNIKMLP